MIEKLFNSPTSMLLNKSMDTASIRNTVIADNIANINTPNFKRNEVIFEEKLQEALLNSNKSIEMYTTNKRHIFVQSDQNFCKLEPEIVEMNDISFRNDGNNVDIDVESARLAKNKLFYDSLTQSMTNEFKLLRLAITGRG
ncbi:MAG TPA: flagellar basal body rod protein FlgB [Syntrophomonadaceae bacterium]|nr:flagellar basal body rod protein FlgB [Syntrophomonadaceae bacterium]